MTGADIKVARLAAGRTQLEAAGKLGVTQAYLSMLENGERRVPPKLGRRAVATFKLPPTMLPLTGPAAKPSSNRLEAVLGRLGYSGFAYLKGAARMNPAALLMAALDVEDLDSRVVEGLPWVALRFPEMDWDWLTSNAKLRNRQNRLAFVVSIATAAAKNSGDSALASTLDDRRNALEKSRLAGEDTLCRQSMTQAERRWLRVHRTAAAKHWNLLTDLSAERLSHLYA
jgi:transcriptional regulator with XRE-family HTH domain